MYMCSVLKNKSDIFTQSNLSQAVSYKSIWFADSSEYPNYTLAKHVNNISLS